MWDPKNIFAGTAWYYSRYRPVYPDEIFRVLADKFGLNSKSRVLDLGCGTGQIALSIAPFVSEVIAIDPQEEMMREARTLATAQGITNINWVLAESGDLKRMAASLKEMDLTIIAQAFHWMDREQTLSDLYFVTRVGGGVAVITDSGPRDPPKPPWREIINETVKYWLGDERKAGTSGTYSHPIKSHEWFLQESEFQNYEVASVKVERTWSVDQLIGYLYSASFSSLPVLGEKRESFEADIRTKLNKFNPFGQFTEPVTIEIKMVWKAR